MSRILVVDDEVGIRELLSEILTPTSCCSTSGCPTPTASRC